MGHVKSSLYVAMSVKSVQEKFIKQNKKKRKPLKTLFHHLHVHLYFDNLLVWS